jgi:AraC-like DNA-binding protein
VGPDLHAASYIALAALIEALDRLTQPSVEANAGSETMVMIRQALTKALLRALLESSLPAALFLACAAAFKLVAEADPTESPFRLANRAQSLILKTLSRTAPRDARVVAALTMLESGVRDHQRLKGKEIAGLEAVSPGHLSGLVYDETGFHFTDWRSAYLLRPSLTVLAETKEHVKQIACRLLHFSHVSQFNHEFKALFGLSPSEFRDRSQRSRG